MKKKLIGEIVLAIVAVVMIVLGYLVYPQYMSAWWLGAAMLVGLVEIVILKNSGWWGLSFVPLVMTLVYVAMVTLAEEVSLMNFLLDINKGFGGWLDAMSWMTVGILVLKLLGKLLEKGLRSLAHRRPAHH